MATLKESLTAGIKMFFSRKELLPSTLYFLILTIGYTILKIRYSSNEITPFFQEYPWIWTLILTTMVYFFVAFFLNLTEFSAKMILKQDRFWASFSLMIVWLGGIFVALYFYQDSLSAIISKFLIAGAYIWIAINAIILNGAIMDLVKFDTTPRFSFGKYILAIIIQLGIIATSYYFGFLIDKIFVYWAYVGIVLLFFMIIGPRRALNTAVYFFVILLYYVIYILYYMKEATGFIFSGILISAIILQMIVISIQFFVFFVAIGKFGAVSDIENKKKINLRKITLFGCYSAFSYVVFEFLIYFNNPEINDPPLYILQIRFLGIAITATIVYIYWLFKRKSPINN